jgi:hypothetical protein
MNENMEYSEHVTSSLPVAPLAPSAPPPPPPSYDDPNETVDERLRRLESALAAMQDTKLMEERLLERMVHRIDQGHPNGAADSAAADAMLNAGAKILPGAMRRLGARLNAATSPSAAPSGGILSAKSWLLTDLIQEIRTFFVMFLDYRYRSSWLSRIVPIVAFVIFVLSWIFMHGSVPFVGSLLDYALDFFLVVIVYKTLQREAERYRSVIPATPPRS